jgi:hypothetical protein
MRLTLAEDRIVHSVHELFETLRSARLTNKGKSRIIKCLEEARGFTFQTKEDDILDAVMCIIDESVRIEEK